MWMSILHACTSVHQCGSGAQSLEGSIRPSGVGVTGGSKLPCGCCKLNPGLLEEQPRLLTTEPSLQSLFCLYFETILNEIISPISHYLA